MTTRRKFFAFLASIGAAVVAAPLMRRKESEWVPSSYKTIVTIYPRTWSISSDGYWADGGKIRFIDGEPQIISGWDA